MFHRSLPLSTSAAGIAAACTVAGATAQERPRHPDHRAVHGPSRDRLSVVQDAQGFSITDTPAHRTASPTTAQVPLGTYLTFDRALFLNIAPVREAFDVPRREWSL